MRADKFFAAKFGSRTKAAEELNAGRILRGGKALSPKDEVSEADEFAFIVPCERFVSGGGYKLSRALKEFSYDCTGKIFADIGASTGGFTDCLLQNGAKKVFAVDVGESLLHPSLVSDPRVVRMENINARYLSANDFPCTLHGVTADVSFISLKHIFPVISAILGDNKGAESVADEGGRPSDEERRGDNHKNAKDAFVLIKPQFECDNKGIGKSGVVKKTEHKKIVEKVLTYALEAGLYPVEITNAPIKKGKNLEYILHLQKYPYEANGMAISANTARAATGRILKETERILKSVKEQPTA
ncbi:MAG: TlyA family RNA methyltransferase [Candidatus Borkfalkiaceae bacterium]|nr:TlyA family RNA methyltransferase [Clostridia bacterium]MDY6224009.1 TlyA family RNA methyltransferase [Christensenellaceae bacterium]